MIITKKRALAGIFLVTLALSVVGFSRPALAQTSNLFESQTGLSEIGNRAYGNETPVDVRETASKLIMLILTFIAMIFVVLIVVAGFQYMTAGGNEEKTKAAISLLTNAVIGLFIIMIAWAITRFTIRVLDRTARNNAVDYTSDYPNY
jgi:Na+-driven multidrug efflux pump